MISPMERSRILVVDDDPGILRAVSRVFAQQHEVVCAASGPEAKAVLGQWKPDVAVVDLRMPEIDGIELMHWLHQALPELDVIIMTGNAQDPDSNLVKAIEAGAFYFIQKPFDRRVLLTLVARCLELRRIREERRRYVERLEQDMEDARRFQMSMLPPSEIRLPGLSVSARYLACQALAGDFYDYAEVDDHTAALLIADVVGHGTSAAMMTSVVKSAFHAARSDRFDPLGVVQRVKEGIRAFDESRFITLCSARLEIDSRRLLYANAGHPPIIMHRPGADVVLLESTAPLLCPALSDLPCEAAEITLREGDSLLFYTDGLIEARGPQGMFGREGIASVLAGEGIRGPQLLDALLSAMSEFAAGRQIQDDITLLSAELCPNGEP
ncbi:MAG: SpoIIE family protein phosphatase [Pirellulales bacterium]|nr:SpoIIE family protein phosphatase [Pirellulales bacterium]